MTVLTVTMNPSIDKSSSVDRVLPDRKLRCNPPSFEPGGGGINVSRVLKTLGGDSTALYPMGGPPGRLFGELLDAQEIPHRPIGISGWTRENLMVLEQSDGQQFRFGMPGPELSPGEWDKCLERIVDFDPRPDFVVASGSLPPGTPKEFYALLARSCRDRGIDLIVDTSGDALKKAVEEGVFLIKPNMRELCMLAGEDLEGERGQEDFVRSLIAAGRCRFVVVSLGAAGVLAASEESMERLRAPSVTIVSKVGAGDSTVAGTVFGLSQGKTFKDAVRMGMAAGSAAVMTPGSMLCRREDVFNLYDRLKNAEAGGD